VVGEKGWGQQAVAQYPGYASVRRAA